VSPADRDPAILTGDISAGRDVNFGLTPEQVKELTEAAARGATGPLTSAIVDLSKRLGVTEDSTKTLLRIVGEQDVPLERLSETLNRVANDYKRLQAQAAALNPENPTARWLVAQAKAAIDAGQLAQAHELLREATQAQLAAAQAARKLREQAQAAEDAQMLGAASVTAVNAGVALTEGKYQQAAELFGQAAEYVPPEHPDERSSYLSGQADALYRQGDERGDNAALRSAIEVFRDALKEWTRERVPLEWATTQNYLGIALWTLGERENGTERLLEAVDAYRDALKEWTRERVPLQWAMTQNNLGNALTRLGERENGTERLLEAVVAYRDALEEWTRERVPLQWAMTQNNLGNALWTLGERENGTERLLEAVVAYRDALKEWTRERVPLQWAMTQNNLGNAQALLSERLGLLHKS
jgi:tetratricopeptide (TPR) repeat protein